MDAGLKTYLPTEIKAVNFSISNYSQDTYLDAALNNKREGEGYMARGSNL